MQVGILSCRGSFFPLRLQLQGRLPCSQHLSPPEECRQIRGWSSCWSVTVSFQISESCSRFYFRWLKAGVTPGLLSCQNSKINARKGFWWVVFNAVLPAEQNKFHSCQKLNWILTGECDFFSAMKIVNLLLFPVKSFLFSPTPVPPGLAVLALVPQCLLLPLLSAADQ